MGVNQTTLNLSLVWFNIRKQGILNNYLAPIIPVMSIASIVPVVIPTMISVVIAVVISTVMLPAMLMSTAVI